MEGKDTTLSPTWDEARWASRRNLSAWLLGLLMGAILVFAIGCTTPRNHDVSVNTNPAAHGRSVSFLPAELGYGTSYSGPRWYDHRNDQGLEVFAGYDVFEESTVVTRDTTRINVNDGRVRDNSRTWTTSETIRIRVR
ncbi:MAG: hypothetical protein AAGH92_09975 [Planctomycetota bacterium]